MSTTKQLNHLLNVIGQWLPTFKWRLTLSEGNTLLAEVERDLAKAELAATIEKHAQELAAKSVQYTEARDRDRLAKRVDALENALYLARGALRGEATKATHWLVR